MGRPLPGLTRLTVLLALAVLTAGTLAAQNAPAAPTVPPPHVAGVLVRVGDLEAASGFYRSLGFEPAAVHSGADPRFAALRNDSVELLLMRVSTPAPMEPLRRPAPRPAAAYLNLQVDALDAAAVADLRDRGVTLLADEPETSAVGPSLPIADPSGNPLHLMDLSFHQGPVPRPRVFNFGLTLDDIAAARAFYGDLLGFRVLSEDYYPPALPLVTAGRLALVLHDSAAGPRVPAPPDQAQMNLLLVVPDLATARAALEARGARVEAAPDGFPEPAAVLYDPFGHVHLLVERSP